MSTVTTTYNRYSTLENDPQYTVRAAMERFKKSQAESVEKKKNDDMVAFSDQGKALAASSSRSREELESLTYESLLRFEAEDGSVVTVDLALEGEEGAEQYTAARITITRPDGSEESLYFSRDLIGKQPEAAEKEAAVAGETEAAVSSTENPAAKATEEAMPSLLELIEEYGLNTIADASESLSAAIRARIEAMIQAAEETAEETEALEKVKAERASRNEAGTGTETTAGGDETQGAQPEGSLTGASRARTLSSYTRNAAASFGASTGKFSRHY